MLNAGTNYFYCQQNLGRRETSGQWTNVWWAKTDDDSGNTNVFVSDVYIKGGDNDEPVPGSHRPRSSQPGSGGISPEPRGISRVGSATCAGSSSAPSRRRKSRSAAVRPRGRRPGR